MIDKKRKRKVSLWVGATTGLMLIIAFSYHIRTHVNPPKVTDTLSTKISVFNPEKDFYVCRKNFLQKSNSGLWELYIEGTPFERGVIEGKLTRNLIGNQEKAFLDRLNYLVPSSFYQRFLKYFIYWFNRDLDKNISEEDKLQIYGISLSASDAYSFMGSGYQRMLNYHSAHDIGHALVNMGMVGCTSFGVWNSKSDSGKMMIGRNFDFYMGDEFAKEKIVCFEKPDKGHPFMIITWGGMIGAVSGMNDRGLTVTINAAKSSVPFSAKTPISLLAREILQYAANIREAYKIAMKRKTFVSESILIGSAEDNTAVIFEKSPDRLDIVEPRNDYIICTNHFQSCHAQSDPRIIKDMNENATSYRYRKVLEDISSFGRLKIKDVATILRDRSGINGDNPGLGNEKAINQLICHHSIIFEPTEGKVWISTEPWQVGPYVCYDIYKIFHNFAPLQKKTEIRENDQTIASDDFLFSADYRQFLKYKRMRSLLGGCMKSGKPELVSDNFIQEFINANPDFFEAYEMAGDHYRQEKKFEVSSHYYRQALAKILPGKKDQSRLVKKLAGCLAAIKNQH